MKHLVLTRSASSWASSVVHDPGELSGFSHSIEPAKVVLSCPLSVALAAPDLLEALENMLAAIDEEYPDGKQGSKTDKAYALALAAIRKATAPATPAV